MSIKFKKMTKTHTHEIKESLNEYRQLIFVYVLV